MDSGLSAQTVTNADLLKDFRKLSLLPTAKKAKSTIQLSKDGSTVIPTRRHSTLARILAHVFTKLSSKDFFDSYGIANKKRQKRAVDKFFEIMEKKYHYENTGASLKSLSLAELDARLQESGANSLREWLFIGEFDHNKIASGKIADNLKFFAGIENYNDLSERQQEALKMVHDGWQSTLKEEMGLHGFSNYEIGFALASMIEEAKPLLDAMIEHPDKAIEYVYQSDQLANMLATFIDTHTQKSGSFKNSAAAAMKMMVEFSKFANKMGDFNWGEEWPRNFAKYEQFAVIQAAAKMRKEEKAASNIAAGGGTALAAIVGQSFTEEDFPRIISMDPLFSRCASFEPIKAALNMNGLLRGAKRNCNSDESKGNIDLSEVRGECVRTATDTINEHGYRQLLTNTMPRDFTLADFEENQYLQASFEQFSGFDWRELTNEQKERAVSIGNDLKLLSESLNPRVPFRYERHVEKYFLSMRQLIAKFINNKDFAEEYTQNAEILKENAKILAKTCLGHADVHAYPGIAKTQTKLIQPLMFLTRSLGKDFDIELLSDLIAFKAANSLEKDDGKMMYKAVKDENSRLSTYLLSSRFAQTFIADDSNMTSDQLRIDEDFHQEALTKSITQKIALFAYILNSSSIIGYGLHNLQEFQEDKIWLRAGRLTEFEKEQLATAQPVEYQHLASYGEAINKSIIEALQS